MTLAKDFPDWNPPRDRPQDSFAQEFTGTLAAGTDTQFGVSPDVVQNAVIAAGFVPTGCALAIGGILDAGNDKLDRFAIAQGPLGFTPTLLSVNTGGGMLLGLYNTSGSDWVYQIDLTTYAGTPNDLVLPAQYTESAYQLPVPGSADSDLVDLEFAPEYTRATLSVSCDQPFSVTLRRAQIMFHPGPVLVTFDEVVVAPRAAGDATVDVPLGANGVAYFVTGTGATPGHANVIARMYRAAGF